VKELSRALAEQGYETHLYFVGDPELPGVEPQLDGRLTLHRWSQWISKSHPGGVYDGEDGKIRDWNHSLPSHLIDAVVTPAAKAGKRVVVLGEEWHTAWSMSLLSDALFYRGLRDRAVILWNANNLFGFDRIDFKQLQRVSTVTTVSRYMKHRMWEWQVNPIVIPNGIPASAIKHPPARTVSALREAARAELFCFKIGRFDPDKRWLMAIAALGLLKRQGLSVRLLMRGGREPHGADVLAHAAMHGLKVMDVQSPREVAGVAKLLREAGDADVLNLVSFLPEELLGPIYASADAVLANSGHEPFGLVGLEVMAAGGLAVTGSTGEDYAAGFRNAIVLETDDPLELVTALHGIRDTPALAQGMRKEGVLTAADYTWEKVIEQLLYRVELAAIRQGSERVNASPL
jgi:glycosyltransferase involved in cell wall biosynthesis